MRGRKDDNVPAAIEDLEEMGAEHPRATSVWRFLAECYSEMKQHEEAAGAYEKCLALQPNSPYVQRAYAVVCRTLGDQKKAEELYRAVLAEYPGETGASQELGKMLVRQQRFEEAAEVWTKGFQNHPTERPLLDGFDKAMAKLGRTDKFVDVLQGALTQNPTLHLARCRLAGRLGLIGRQEEAIAMLREGVKLFPENNDLANNLALMLTDSGAGAMFSDTYEAVTLTELICRRTGFKNLRYMRTLASVYKAAYRVDEAIAVLQRAQGLVGEPREASVGRTISAEIDLLKEFQARGVTPVTPPAALPTSTEPPDQKID